ncbi:MAG: hypothetical protein GY749_32400 [Desulfobacteraceae bacterium]|nr:hypothetical protein [Desulfobacteraceae bacterium]
MDTEQSYYEQDISEESLRECAIQYSEKPVQDHGKLLGYLLVFRIQDQWFGLETKAVSQITDMENGVAVPRSKSLLLGLFNQRGVFIPIIDIRQFLHIPPDSVENQKQGKQVVMESEHGQFCFLVDELHDVEEIYENCLMSKSVQSEEKASPLVKSIVEISLKQKKQKVIWLKSDILDEMVREGL